MIVPDIHHPRVSLKFTFSESMAK